MSDVYTRDKKGHRQGTALDNSDIEGAKFANWLTGRVIENYAYEISKYCDSMKNCEYCQFFNGTCRLNNRPYSWDMKSF